MRGLLGACVLALAACGSATQQQPPPPLAAAPARALAGSGAAADTPPRPPPIPTLVPRGSIAAGDRHACAVTAAAKVACWGDDSGGSLGTAGVTTAPAPLLVGGVADAIGVAAGPDTSCAWTRTGSVWCWGGDDLGAPMTGTGSGSGSTAHRVPGLTDIIAVVDDGDAPCGLHRDGHVACWSHDDWADPLPAPIVDLANLDHVVELAGGARGLCARTASGDVVCLMASSPDREPDPHDTTPLVIAPAHGATSLAGYDERFVALVGDQIVTWWLPVLANAVTPMPAEKFETIPHVTDATRVSIGGVPQHPTRICATGRTTRCWPLDAPEAAVAFDAPDIRDIAVGGEFICARSGDRVACTGPYGLLGDGERDHPDAPVMVAGLTDAQQIEVQYQTACALRAGGGVACWGARWGAFAPHSGDFVVDPAPVDLPGLHDAVEIAMSLTLVCARHRAGGVSCWEVPRRGQERVERRVPELADAVSLLSGDQVCGIHGSGDVTCLGTLDQDPSAAITAARAHGEPCAPNEHHTPACWHGSGPITGTYFQNQLCLLRGAHLACRYDEQSPFVLLPNSEHALSFEDGYLLREDGTVADRNAPGSPLEKLQDIIALRAGADLVCALFDVHHVACWGKRGLLGDGEPTAVTTPIVIPGLALAPAARLVPDTSQPPPAPSPPPVPDAVVTSVRAAPLAGPFRTRDAMCATLRCERDQTLDCPADDGRDERFHTTAPLDVHLTGFPCTTDRGRNDEVTYHFVVKRADGWFLSAPIAKVPDGKWCAGTLRASWESRPVIAGRPSVVARLFERTECRGGGASTASDVEWIAAIADGGGGKPVAIAPLTIGASTATGPVRLDARFSADQQLVVHGTAAPELAKPGTYRFTAR